MSDNKQSVGRFPHPPLTTTEPGRDEQAAARRVVLRMVEGDDVDIVLAMLDLDDA